MKNHSIKANAVLNIIYTITNMIFPLLTFPYVSRILLADRMGKVSFFSSLSSYGVMVAALGISTYGIRATAKVRDHKKELSKVSRDLLLINMVAALVVIVSLVLSVPFVAKFRENTTLLMIHCVLIFFSSIGMDWFYSGLEQYEYITKRSIAFKTISLVLVFLLVREQEDYIIYAGITVFSAVASYICNFLHARKFIDFRNLGKPEIQKHMKPMLLLFSSILAVNIYTNLDTLMLGFVSGDREVGIYTVAVKSKWILLSVVNSISAVLLPRLSYYLSENKMEEYHQTLRKSVNVIVMLSVSLTVFFVMEAADCIRLLGGEDYMAAVPCMQVVMPILVISGLSNITGNQILIPSGKDRCFMKAVSIGAVADLILNLILMPQYGCMGAAIATLAAELIQMSIQLFYARDYMLPNIRLEVIVKILLASAIAAAGLYYIQQFLHYHVLMNLMLAAAVFYGIYVVVILMIGRKFLLELK